MLVVRVNTPLCQPGERRIFSFARSDCDEKPAFMLSLLSRRRGAAQEGGAIGQPLSPPTTTSSSTSGQEGNKRRRSPSPDHHSSLAPPPSMIMGGDTAPTAAPTGLGAPFAPSVIKLTSLTTFISSDIDPQSGHRLLLPLLTTMDCLHLSECCRDLLKYRHHLSRVKLVPHPSPSPAMERSLLELLEGQASGVGLEYLQVDDKSLLHVLSLPCFSMLKTLVLSCEHYEAEEAGCVGSALMGGGLESLEALELLRTRSMEASGVHSILGALRRGACPGLGGLKVTEAHISGDAMAGTLKSGHLRYLQDLDLTGSTLGSPGSMEAVIRALQGGACPQLVRLALGGCGLLSTDGIVLGTLMDLGGLAKLEYLDLHRNKDMGDQACFCIVWALEKGSCPLLKALNLNESSVGYPAANSLGRALFRCQHLETLALNDAFSDPDVCLNFLHAISDMGQGVMPNLLHLDLGDNGMSHAHGQMLGGAIGQGVFPKLEVLCLEENKSLGNGGIWALMVGLEGGGCPFLKELVVDAVGMSPHGGRALGRALASGELGCLQKLSLSDNENICDEAMREVMVGLKRCHQLRELDVRETDMGPRAGRALVQALQEGAWPRLTVIDASGSWEAFEDDEVGKGLLEVIEAGKVAKLEEMRLDGSGLSQEVVAGILAAVDRGICPKLDRESVVLE